MKKVVLASIIAATSLMAASDKQIEDFYSEVFKNQNIDGVNVKVVERTKILDDIEKVSLKFSKGDMSQEDVTFVKGDLMFPDVVNLKEQKSYLAEEKKVIAEKAALDLVKSLAKIYKNEDKANVITLGNDSKKPTLIMFSDPECPYCRAELAKIETTLKDNNVEIILTPVHELSSLQKSALIYKDIKNAKSDSDKVKILRKYFSEDYNVDEKNVNKEESDKIDTLRKKYFSAGVRSVPFIINKSDLK